MAERHPDEGPDGKYRVTMRLTPEEHARLIEWAEAHARLLALRGETVSAVATLRDGLLRAKREETAANRRAKRRRLTTEAVARYRRMLTCRTCGHQSEDHYPAPRSSCSLAPCDCRRFVPS